MSRIGEAPYVTRVTVVGPGSGVVYEKYDLYENGVYLELQDEGQTLKIFPVMPVIELTETEDGTWTLESESPEPSTE